MQVDKVEVIGNLTTVAKILICMIAPIIAVKYGIDGNLTEELLVAVVGLLFGLIDAKFPNTIFREDGA